MDGDVIFREVVVLDEAAEARVEDQRARAGPPPDRCF